MLRERVVADRDVPPFDRVAMDGIAVASAGLSGGVQSFRVASTQAAGEPPHALPEAGACVEIMTGAALPDGCDAVVRYEDLVLADGQAALREGVVVTPGQNIHGRGTDRRAGEPVLAPGVRLGPPRVAALAALGRAEVRVSAVPRVSVVTTGDEVVAVDAPVLPHQIRQSNGPAIGAALALRGYVDARLAQWPTPRAPSAEAGRGPRRVRRAGDLRRRVGRPVRSRAVGAGGARRARGVPQGPPEAGEAAVVRRGPGGTPVFGLPGIPSPLSCASSATWSRSSTSPPGWRERPDRRCS